MPGGFYNFSGTGLDDERNQADAEKQKKEYTEYYCHLISNN